jgi:hypothetical protein
VHYGLNVVYNGCISLFGESTKRCHPNRYFTTERGLCQSFFHLRIPILGQRIDRGDVHVGGRLAAAADIVVSAGCYAAEW